MYERVKIVFIKLSNWCFFQALVRDNIVQAVVQAPEVIRIQLSVCISMIIKHDFPHKWPQVVDHISIHLEQVSQTFSSKFHH